MDVGGVGVRFTLRSALSSLKDSLSAYSGVESPLEACSAVLVTSSTSCVDVFESSCMSTGLTRGIKMIIRANSLTVHRIELSGDVMVSSQLVIEIVGSVRMYGIGPN